MRKLENVCLNEAASKLEDEFANGSGVVMVEYIMEGYKEIWDVQDDLFRRVRDNYSTQEFNKEWTEFNELLGSFEEPCTAIRVNVYFLM